MPFKKPTSGDTRGWTPKEVEDNTKYDKSERTGYNQTPRAVISVEFSKDAARVAERGVPLDNMGNSPSNNGQNVTPRSQAETTDAAPDVPLSSYQGVNVGMGAGISLDEGFRVAPADREVREKTDHAPKAENIVAGDITSGHPAFNKATIPGGFESINEKQFTSDGSNPGNVESKVMGEKLPEKMGPEFKKTVAARTK